MSRRMTVTITCPSCGTSKTETMPTDACQFFYDCTGYGTLLRPKQGDCCVFCSYGSVLVRQFRKWVEKVLVVVSRRSGPFRSR